VFALAFVAQERRHLEAILPLSLFRNRAFVQTILITLCAASMLFSAGQFLPTYVQISLGASARMSGLIATPQGVGVFLSGLLTGQLISRTGRYRLQMIIGSIGLVVSSALLRDLDADAGWLRVAWLLLFSGLAAGLVMPVTQVVIQGSVSQQEQGIASSARQFFMQIAQVMGLSFLGLIFTSSYTTGFVARSSTFAAKLPPAAYEAFRDDPTVALDVRRFEPVKRAIEATPNSAALLEQTLTAQREGVAHGIDMVFTASTVASGIILVICLMMKETTLRRSFTGEPAGAAERAVHATTH
jgi:Na+/melibiose symporter-like transporter